MRQLEKVQSPVLASFSALRKHPDTKALAGAQIIIAIKQLQQRLNLKRDMSDEQIAMFANDLLTDPDFNSACLALFPDFCRRFATGKFGELYESLDGMKLSLAFRQHLADYAAALTRAAEKAETLRRETQSANIQADDVAVRRAVQAIADAQAQREADARAARETRKQAAREWAQQQQAERDFHMTQYVIGLCAHAGPSGLYDLLASIDTDAVLAAAGPRCVAKAADYIREQIAKIENQTFGSGENNFAEALDTSEKGVKL